MTVSQSVIEWLMLFDVEKLKSINTDIRPAKVNSYALIKEPVVNVKKFISGTQIVTEHYVLMALLDSQDNADRKENSEFGEQLEQWISERCKNKEFPEIDGAKVESVEVTTPFYLGSKESTNESVYQLSISIKYRKG